MLKRVKLTSVAWLNMTRSFRTVLISVARENQDFGADPISLLGATLPQPSLSGIVAIMFYCFRILLSLGFIFLPFFLYGLMSSRCRLRIFWAITENYKIVMLRLPIVIAAEKQTRIVVGDGPSRKAL